MKYRLTKVIDRHYPRSNYTNFQLVEDEETKEDKKHDGYIPRRKRHPLGRMKFHSNCYIAQEFRRCTQTSLFVPASKSIIEKLKVDSTVVSEDEEEEDILCLDNPVNTDNFLASQTAEQTDGTEKSVDPTEESTAAIETERAAKRTGMGAEVYKSNEVHQSEEFDEFFGHESGDQCVEVNLDKAEPPCRPVDLETSDSETSDDETLVPEKTNCLTNCLGTGCNESKGNNDGAENSVTLENADTLENGANETTCKSATAAAPQDLAADQGVCHSENSAAKTFNQSEFTTNIETPTAVESSHTGARTETIHSELERETKLVTELTSAPIPGALQAVSDLEQPLEMDSSLVQAVQNNETDTRMESQVEEQTELQREQTDKQITDPLPHDEEVKRVEHIVSLPTTEKDSSTEDETSAVKINSDNENDSVKSIIKQGSGDKSYDKSVKFSK